MSKLVLCATAIAAALLPACAAAAPLSLDQAVDLAVQRSPAVSSARAGSAGSAATAQAAGQLPDPVLTAGVENLPVTGPDRFSTTRDFQTMKRVGISQEWVSADKRAAREAVARAQAERERTTERIVAAQTRLQAALAYIDAFYAGESLELATRSEHHAHEELEAGKGRLAAASGSSAEVLGLATSLGLAEDESDEVRQQQGVTDAMLRRWVGVPAAGLAAPALAAAPTEVEFVARHPDVVARQRDVDVARRAFDVVRREREANWTWAVSYAQRSGYADMVSFGVSIPLQVAPAARQDRQTAASLALSEKAEAELAEARRAAEGEYAALTSDVLRLQARIERLRGGVITPARQRTAAVTAAYGSNQASLVMLFEARHAELAFQRKLLDLERDLFKARAQLVFKPISTGGAQ